MTIRFHLDENVANAVADGLRRKGIDVTLPSEVGLIGARDSDHLEYCRLNNRVLVTHDDDFLALHHGGALHAGIAYCPPRSRSFKQIIYSLVLIWELLEEEEIKNRIEYL